MTLNVSNKNIELVIISITSLCRISPLIPSIPPSRRDPQSPIKILAGYRLRKINPKVAPKLEIRRREIEYS